MRAEDPHMVDYAKRLLGEEGYRQAFAPIEQASGLPNAAYWSADWLALEQERIFRRSWVFAAAEAEVPEPGDILPVEVGGAPLIVLRDRTGVTRAFHNVCRHRGTRLVAEACRKPVITCPYHAWCYGLDGKLKVRPHFHGPDRGERFRDGAGPALDLVPVRAETWNGCVFVDLSGIAAPLEDWLRPMLERTASFDFSRIRWIAKKSYTIKANWKLVLENYMEGYHVFAAHPRLIAHAPMSVRWSGEWRDHVFYNDYIAPEVTPGRGDQLPHYPNLTGEDLRRGLWFACFPNFAAEAYADQFVVLSVNPRAPDETVEDLHFFVVGEEAARSPDFAVARQDLLDMWHDLNLEDVALLEGLQAGRRSPAFRGSRMSPAWEVPAHQLARKVLSAVVAEAPV